jgi:predicted enzyme related to lactoylglutathione lyase
VVHFEIQADDPARAQTFYAAVFGWRFDDYAGVVGVPYWGVITGEDTEPGINGGLLPRPAARPGPEQGTNAFVCTVQVDDYDACESRILQEGGAVALPKYALTGMAWQGYYLDPEGNTFGIHQPDLNAA